MANESEKYPNSFFDAREDYFQCQYLLNTISPTLKAYVDNLYKKVTRSFNQMYIFNMPTINIDDETFLEIIKNFFYSFNDQDIKKAIDYIINNKLYELLPFDEKNPECKIYNGYVIKTNDNSKDFILRLYRYHTIQDLQIGVHEFGHAITKVLFTDKVNPIFYYFFTENDAYYFELFFLKTFLPKIIKSDNDIAFILEQNRLIKTCKYITLVKIMDIIYNNCGEYFNQEKINAAFSEVNMPFQVKSVNDLSIDSNAPLRAHSIINSYMLALIQVDETIKDIEKGLYTFKNMQTDPIQGIDSIEKLLKKYDMDYTKSNPLFDESLENHKKLKKMIDEGEIA